MSTERVCAIQGTPHIVIEAITTILDIILVTQVKGPVKLYDPFHYDVYSAADYGGFTEPGPPGAYKNVLRGPTGATRRGDMGHRVSPWEREPMPPPPPPEVWGRMGPQVYNDAPPGTERRGVNRHQPPPASQLYSRWVPGGKCIFI